MLGLSRVHPNAVVESLPVVSGYIGADAVATALFLGLESRRDTSLVLDLGTNAEILLCHRGRVLACSAAAGPAFEGGRIRSGMRAQPGAIDSFSYDPASGELRHRVLGGRPPGASRARASSLCWPSCLTRAS